MNSELRRAFDEDPEAVRAAGHELAAIGALLAEGRIEEAEARAAAAEAAFPEWAELDQATEAIDAAAAERERAEAARDAVVGIVVAVLRAAIKSATGL